MAFTIHQDLALKYPIKQWEEAVVDGRHHCWRWLMTDVQVNLILTVAIPEVGYPFWHVSASVNVRDTGTMFMAGMNKKMRRRLRDVALEMVKSVGSPPEKDTYDIGERALHVMRILTDSEILHMEEFRVQ